MGRKKKDTTSRGYILGEIVECFQDSYHVIPGSAKSEGMSYKTAYPLCQRIEPFGLLIRSFDGQHWMINVRLVLDKELARLKEIEALDRLKDKIGGIQKIVAGLR